MNYIKDFGNFCEFLSKESASIIRKYFRKKVTIENKSDNSPVTIADRLVEEKLRTLIHQEFPEHGIIGEEFGNENEKAEFTWVLDPIDGTKSFISGTLSFGTLIALLYKKKPVLGVIHHPIMDEFLIGDNRKTLLNKEIVKIRKLQKISQATLLTTDHRDIKQYQKSEYFEKLMKQVKIYRTWGDCYGYYLLATGYADIMIDPIMSFWDIMALIPIVQGAGGIITDYQGGKAELGKSIVAASQQLHSQVIKTINGNH